MIFIKFADYLNNQYTLHNMKKLLTLFLLASLAASAAWARNYVKVTSTADIKSGRYLIVYETDSKILDGSRTDLDVKGNYQVVTISNNKIVSTAIIDSYSFEIGKMTTAGNTWFIRSASGFYIGNTADKNQMLFSETIIYENTISVDANGNADVVADQNGSHLRFNSATDQLWFRYFKASTYTNQKAIQLYKLEDFPTVTGISEFKGVVSGTTVQLYLPDANNARVTHVENNSNGTIDAYVRDNTGAMRMTGISPNRPMTYNQHLAGWITGKYTVGSDGIPQFEPVEDLTNTAFFVIADPVTESDTKPVEINSNQVGDHLADWVTIKDVTVDNSIDNTKFNLDYSTDVYNGALVDVDAIAANGKLYPVNDDNGYPITFVVDASKSFVSPSADISDAKIRLKRTLSASNWNFLTVPFDIYESEFDGQVLEYTGIELGKVGEYTYHGQVYDITGGIMKFEPYSGTMFAGKPYLVKPASAVEEQTFMEVTLSKSAPSVVKYTISAAQGAMGIGTMAETTPAYVGDYSLVGTFEPTTLPKNESTVMLDGNEISWTSRLDDTDVNATEAYITIPDGAGVKLDLGSNGTVTAINTVMIHPEIASEQVIYNLMGVRMTRPLSELPPGVYIVNGKKIVKR